MLLKIAFLILMTSPDDVIFLKFREIHGQYFPLSNFKKKDILVFSSLSSIRLGLSPKGLEKRKRPTVTECLYIPNSYLDNLDCYITVTECLCVPNTYLDNLDCCMTVTECLCVPNTYLDNLD